MSTHALSRANRASVLRVLQHSDPLSRADIAERTELSLATVSRAVNDLVKMGFVCQAGSLDRTGGRPRAQFTLSSDAVATLAVDVADHHTDVALIGLAGNVILSQRHEIVDADPSARLTHTIRVVTSTFPRASKNSPRIIAVGVSVPGPVQADGTIDFAPSLQWHNVRLGSILRQELNVPVAVHNDANLIALAEATYGELRNPAALVALAVFEGVGSGLVFNGRLWHGNQGSSGQIGRMLLSLSALQNIYVGYGDLESHLGSEGIRNRAAKAGLELDPDREVFRELFLVQAEKHSAARELTRLFTIEGVVGV
ncbi:hypothetical protein BSZ39_10945 [Bowdeniella nasicola]|uniref:HTH marR-type domain-containing protein n=1 Tax=Bowdeniella nasicola TaxID=208480 RepID=A0A1Q5Q0B8_9ACTO|nr:ROK family transcriptional regulator [Bowdeniella nasicola]OKL53155.1 hypothetical protein BSZ39_10945 [Bowdeniella nasicola]